MTPLHISDPVLPHRRTRKKSGMMSGPIVVMIVAAMAGVPPIANRLVALDTTLHAHNDAIVSWLLAATPFLLIALAVFGLWAMFGGKGPATANSGPQEFDSGFYRQQEGRP